MHEAMDFVFCDELGALTCLMLFKPLSQVVCHANIERAVLSTGENVDVIHGATGGLRRNETMRAVERKGP